MNSQELDYLFQQYPDGLGLFEHRDPLKGIYAQIFFEIQKQPTGECRLTFTEFHEDLQIPDQASLTLGPDGIILRCILNNQEFPVDDPVAKKSIKYIDTLLDKLILKIT